MAPQSHKKRQPWRVALKSLIKDQLQQDPSIRHLRGGGELSKENNNIRKQVSIQILIVIRGSAITKRALNDAARFVQFSLLQNGHFQIKNTHDALLPIAFELKVRKTRSVWNHVTGWHSASKSIVDRRHTFVQPSWLIFRYIFTYNSTNGPLRGQLVWNSTAFLLFNYNLGILLRFYRYTNQWRIKNRILALASAFHSPLEL